MALRTLMGTQPSDNDESVAAKEPATDLTPAQRGRRMAEILEQIAVRGGVAEITDPLAWEREMRQDRPLPGRDSES